jgi:integrative and conjugative element protein (TIGR02256 family)
VREWLALTAKGKLHQGDQPLEPLLLDYIGTIVLPVGLLDGDAGKALAPLSVTVARNEPGKYFLIAERSGRQPEKKGLRIVASVHRSEPQQHGLIRHRPRNIKELAEFVSSAGLDLRGELRARLSEWQAASATDPGLLDALPVLILSIPKLRAGGEAAESRDVWAFLSAETVREAGQKLGVWQVTDGHLGVIIGGDAGKTGEDFRVDLLNPSFKLARKDAATLNGLWAADPTKIAAVGVGALGSQVAMDLARCGFGTWTLIDDDRLLPHNGARHALDGHFIGVEKAVAVAVSANSLVDGENPFTPLVADILDPQEKGEAVAKALSEAGLILDLSASVTVARHLAIETESPARRVSLFLTPTGDDLVLLAEDRDRAFQLDSLEMQYYRAIAGDDRLTDHFKPRDSRRRYGQSCRDITSDIPQDFVALHAANASRAVNQVSSTPAARIVVWRADRDGNVRRVDVGPAQAIRHGIGDWTVCTDAMLVLRLATLRESKLPKETGGVLLGSFDLEHKLIYIVDTIPSPPDSKEWPTLYIRGCKGLKRRVEDFARKTDGMLEYIGEWHSHPRRCSTAPSNDDLQVFSWLTELMNVDGLPALMMIVGDGGHASCYVGEMRKAESLLPKVAS